MWGLWFNFANAQFSRLLSCLLASLLLPIFITFWMVLGFWASYLVLFLLIFPFYKTNWTRMFFHVDAFSRLGDVQVAFGIPFQYFT
jgi:hypothetical protein